MNDLLAERVNIVDKVVAKPGENPIKEPINKKQLKTIATKKLKDEENKKQELNVDIRNQEGDTDNSKRVRDVKKKQKDISLKKISDLKSEIARIDSINEENNMEDIMENKLKLGAAAAEPVHDDSEASELDVDINREDIMGEEKEDEDFLINERMSNDETNDEIEEIINNAKKDRKTAKEAFKDIAADKDLNPDKKSSKELEKIHK